jgi:hypothetical protein
MNVGLALDTRRLTLDTPTNVTSSEKQGVFDDPLSSSEKQALFCTRAKNRL